MLFSWSDGKDSSLAPYEVFREGEHWGEALLTTVVLIAESVIMV